MTVTTSRGHFDREFTAARRRLRKSIDANAAAAMRDIQKYTKTEHAEAAAGLRIAEKEALAIYDFRWVGQISAAVSGIIAAVHDEFTGVSAAIASAFGGK